MSIFFNLRLSYSLSYASRIFQRSSVYILLKIIIRVFWKNCFLSWPQWYGDEWFDEIEKTIDRSMQLRRACTSEPETTLVLFFMSIPSPSSKGRYIHESIFIFVTKIIFIILAVLISRFSAIIRVLLELKLSNFPRLLNGFRYAFTPVTWLQITRVEKHLENDKLVLQYLELSLQSWFKGHDGFWEDYSLVVECSSS